MLIVVKRIIPVGLFILRLQIITDYSITIDLEKLDSISQKRLDQILGRDFRIIKKYINVIIENKGLLMVEKKSGKQFIDTSD